MFVWCLARAQHTANAVIVTRVSEGRENPGQGCDSTPGDGLLTGWVMWAMGRGGARCWVLQAPVVLPAAWPSGLFAGFRK